MKSVHGEVLVNVLDGLAVIKKLYVLDAATRPTTAITLSDHESDKDDAEPRQAAVDNTHMAHRNVPNSIEDAEDLGLEIDKIISSDDDNDGAQSATANFNGHVLYRIDSATPETVARVPKKRRLDPIENYTEDDMYELDRRDRKGKGKDCREILPLPRRRTQIPSPIQVRQPTQVESRRDVRTGKQHREADDSEFLHHQAKRKVVRIQLPPDEEPVRDHCAEIARLEQLRNMPPPAPRRPRVPPLVFPPPSQLPTTHQGGASTAAFYKAMGGPPPSSRPLDRQARPHHHIQQQSEQSRRPPKPRVPAQIDSDGLDDLSIGPNLFTHPPPSVRFDYQRELRHGQAGPSNERFIPKGRGN